MKNKYFCLRIITLINIITVSVRGSQLTQTMIPEAARGQGAGHPRVVWTRDRGDGNGWRSVGYFHPKL